MYYEQPKKYAGLSNLQMKGQGEERVSITTAGTVRSFPFPTLNEIDGITAGPDGKMWFTSSDLNTDKGSVGNITVS